MSESTQLILSEQFQSELAVINAVGDLIAGSQMYGIKNRSQAVSLMALVVEQDKPIASVMQLLAACGKSMRRYHIIFNRPSMRSDAMQSDFERAGGAIIWHLRNDDMVAGTAFIDAKKIDDAARERALERLELLWQFEALTREQKTSKVGTDLAMKIGKLSREGEETVIRSYADAYDKGIVKADTPWQTNPKAMLTARFVVEVVRLLRPDLITGFMEENEAREAQDLAMRIPETPEGIRSKIIEVRERAAAVDGEERKKLTELAASLEIQLDEVTHRITAPSIVSKGEARTVPLEVVREVDAGHPAADTAKQLAGPQGSIPGVEETTKTPEAVATPPAAEKKPRGGRKAAEKPAGSPANTPPADPAPQDSQKTEETATEPADGAAKTPYRTPEAESQDEWRNHVVQFVALSGVKGLKMGEIAPELVKKCKVKWCDAYSSSIAKDEAKKAEAKAFLAAYRFHFPNE